MKLIAIFLNLLLVVEAVYLFRGEGVPSWDEFFFAVLIFAAPISSQLSEFLTSVRIGNIAV